jgi:hypothetical protein
MYMDHGPSNTGLGVADTIATRADDPGGLDDLVMGCARGEG